MDSKFTLCDENDAMRPKHTVGLVIVSLATTLAAQVPPSWTPVPTTGVPARYRHALAYDSQRGRTVLFGGSGNVGLLGDTWEWNGTAWLPQLFASGPQARQFHAMVYDAQRGRTVMFGGNDGSGLQFGDTWEWNGSMWSLMSTTGPSPRNNHAMAYDSQRGRTVLFSGLLNSGAGDTWEWDGSAWTQVANSGPGSRTSHAMAYDTQRARTVMFGGGTGGGRLADTWEWNGTSWASPSSGSHPGARQGHGMAFDSQRQRTVLFGGSGYNGTTVLAHLRDTWEWDGTSWVHKADSGPTIRESLAMAYDGQRGKTVMHGGNSNGLICGDAWEWDGRSSSTATTFGIGCGNPALTLSPVANSRPTINSTVSVSLANIPASLAFVTIGWSRTTYGPFTLPLTLAGYGLPSCDLLQSCELGAQPTASVGNGNATYSLALPNWSGLIGLRLNLQGWAPAPGVNQAGVIVSNGVEWGIGDW